MENRAAASQTRAHATAFAAVAEAMRRTPALALALSALLALAAGLAWRARQTSGGADERSEPSAAAATRGRDVSNELEFASDTLAPHTLESQVRGTVVDAHGNALAGTRVWISSPGDDWAPGIVPPVVDVLGKRIRAFEARTRADGSFELHVPAPSAERLRLDVLSADHRGAASREFTSGTSGSTSSIAPGENDVGRIALELESSVAGVVRSRAGTAIGGALVTRRRAHAHGGYESTRSDPSGSYVLSRVAAGEYELQVDAPGHLTLNVPRMVVAAATARTDFDLVLIPTPTLSGRVLDTFGAPVAGVEVCAAEVESDAYRRLELSAESAADGTFSIALRSERRHWLWTKSFDHSHWKSWNTPERDFAAGRDGIEVRVASRYFTRVVTTNARTHEPLHQAGIESLDDETPPRTRRDESRAHLRTVPHAETCPSSGRLVELEMPAQRVLVWSPGFTPREWQLSGNPEEVVPLEPLGGLRCVLVRDGTPCATAALAVRRVEAGETSHATWAEVPSPAAEEAALSDHVTVRQRPRCVHADARGAVEITQLQPGAYVLAVLEDGRRWVDPIPRTVDVPAGTCLDLGLLALARARAELRVHILLADKVLPGLAGRGLRATINGQPLSLAVANTIECHDLPSGTVEVGFAEDAPLVCPARRWSVDVAPAQKRELTIDLSDIDMSMLHAHLAPGSLQRFTRRVHLRAADAPAGSGVALGPLSFASDDGTSGTLVRGGGRYVLEACDETGVVLTTSEIIEAPRSGHFDVTFCLP